jgi:hypothetical protein
MFDFLDKIDAKVTQVILAVLIVISIVAGYFSNIINLPDNWEIPVILAALLLIVNMLKKLYVVDENTRKLLENLEVDVLKKYDTYDEYYSDLKNAVANAKKSLDLTHIRHEPPSAFSNSEKYFDSIRDWCRKNRSGYMRRVTTISNERMKQWVRELKATEQEVSNYHVRICKWDAPFPMVNMSIIDKEMVFIALTADIAEKTCGLLIKDKKACLYFVQYFENIWAASAPIPDNL